MGGCGCCGAGALVGPVSLSERLVRPSRLWGNPYFRRQGATLATRRTLSVRPSVRPSVCPHATDAATRSLSLSVAPSLGLTHPIYVHSIHPESIQCPMDNTGQSKLSHPSSPILSASTQQASHRRHCCRGHWRVTLWLISSQHRACAVADPGLRRTRRLGPRSRAECVCTLCIVKTIMDLLPQVVQ